MTDRSERQSHSEQLENIVDDLDEKVAEEREAEGVPGKPSDREQAAAEADAAEGPGQEPPD
ncbi:hypothetical protein [Mycobacterium bourgelatii]|uniref:Uncharacterized protein n=1 Tax=Mycobacterium bourgelatii TaxID=1273442 RepID=A0A7I9YQM0_MYCBU|nr:hypothetical protein [Mycobacterium bourgelatii]MCV6973964.1 hypothetical protein [Mycobacterium bourgelatii]GFG90897.1 hypothetical protein MBOU_29390 [Mycobacterium bourgelatii]